MPEGHTIHRLARRHRRLFVGQRLDASSPQGRFAEGAALINGQVLTATQACGKHLFHDYDDLIVHVHLGLYGKFTDGPTPAPESRGALRLRLVSADRWADLRGPTACEVISEPERQAILDRLGPDPLAAAAERVSGRSRFLARVGRSRAPAGTLLMDQTVIAGVGNVYRAEALFRHAIHPSTPGRDVPPPLWEALWEDLVVLMAHGVRSGRIVTTDPEDRRRPSGRVRRDDSHYVYGRAGLPCRRCTAPVLDGTLAARRVFWCPVCQPATFG